MTKVRKTLHWMTVASVIVALGWLHGLGFGLNAGQAFAGQPNLGFCQITEADALLKRLGERSPRAGIMLVVNEQHVEPGEIVKARLLNFAQHVVSSDAEFKIQRHSRAGWKTDSSSPDGPWPRRAARLRPGHAGQCYRFSVPAEQEPGRYRFLTLVRSGADRQGQVAEFFVGYR